MTAPQSEPPPPAVVDSLSISLNMYEKSTHILLGWCVEFCLVNKAEEDNSRQVWGGGGGEFLNNQTRDRSSERKRERARERDRDKRETEKRETEKRERQKREIARK